MNLLKMYYRFGVFPNTYLKHFVKSDTKGCFQTRAKWQFW